MKKKISVLLAAVMLFCSVFCVNLSAFADYEHILALNLESAVTVNNAGELVEFEFTPTSTASYTFSSHVENGKIVNPYCIINDNKGNPVGSGYYDSTEDNMPNAFSATVELQKDITYSFICGAITVPASYGVVISYALHTHTPVEDIGYPATDTQPGLTNGSHCSICNAVLTEQLVIPTKPQSLATTARGGTGERLKIEWDAAEGATGYNVYRLVDGKYTLAGSTEKTEFVFEDLVPGWEYYFKVAAYNKNVSNEGALSNELHTCAACPPMDLPSVVAMDSKTIQVDWNITNAHGYVVQWSTDPEFKTGLNSAYVTGHTSDSYTISVPGNSQNYYVRTRAWRYWENNSLVYGIWTEGIKYGENLEKVTGLYTSARGGYGEQLKISWDKQRDVDFYNIYRLVDGKYTVVATTTDTSYVFTDVVPGWEYYFKVSSVRNGVESVLSDELHTCAACPPMDVPVLTKVSTTGFAYDALQVNWEVVNSHGYVVQWSTDPSFRTDLHSVYVTGHNKCEYTINTIGIYDSYYVRVRAWRYWDTGLVYGAWSQPSKTILDSADVEWVQEQAHAYIESKGMTVDPTVRSYSGRTSSAPYTTKEALLESVKEAIDVQYQGCIDAGWNGVSMYIKIEARADSSYYIYIMYG